MSKGYSLLKSKNTHGILQAMAQSDSTESILKRFGAASLCTPQRRPTGSIGTPVVSPPGPPSIESPTSAVRKDLMTLSLESPTGQPIKESGKSSDTTGGKGAVVMTSSESFHQPETPCRKKRPVGHPFDDATPVTKKRRTRSASVVATAGSPSPPNHADLDGVLANEKIERESEKTQPSPKPNHGRFRRMRHLVCLQDDDETDDAVDQKTPEENI